MDGLDFPRVGVLPSGQLDAITDVGDIRVGHCTLDEGNVHTGVTVVLPNDDPLMQKPLAASCIFNGFGKSVGLMQMAELGCLETPLALTNTFSVGAIATAQIRAAVSAHPEVGREWSTVNPLVLECNDGYLNDIQALAVTEKHYIEACAPASREFMQGSVGAGRGMSCFHLKGGIGSASRIAECGGQAFTVGALVLSNFGKAEHCLLAGRPVGHLLQERLDRIGAEARPCSPLHRKRAAPSCCWRPMRRWMYAARTAGPAGWEWPCTDGLSFWTWQRRRSHCLFFQPASPAVGGIRRAASSCTGRLDGPTVSGCRRGDEQAIFKALFFAEPFVGRDGHRRPSIQEVLPEWRDIVRS